MIDYSFWPRAIDRSSTTSVADRILTIPVRKPSLVIEQALTSYSFRSSELSQPI